MQIDDFIFPHGKIFLYLDTEVINMSKLRECSLLINFEEAENCFWGSMKLRAPILLGYLKRWGIFDYKKASLLPYAQLK